MSSTSPADRPEGPAGRKPRKIFLLVGVVVAAALGVGLFTSLGTSNKGGPPRAGAQVPPFSASRLNGTGGVQVPGDGGSGGHPAVLLFFGNWCDVCHTELPELAAAVRRQQAQHGALSVVRVIGIDSEDTSGDAKAFIRSSGVTFPVAYDPNDDITSGDFYFEGDPYAVFVDGNGTISAIIAGPISATRFTAAEGKLIPSGS